MEITKQSGGQDCGVYAAAIATALAFGLDPAMIKFSTPAIRPHLIKCIQEKELQPFPTSYTIINNYK